MAPAHVTLADRFAASAAQRLPAAGATLVVAVSGGADSMALWDLCVGLGRWRLVVWHLDHGLRADAAEDGALIHRQAAAYRAAAEPGEVVVERADIAALAREWGLGLEAAGRRHRYARLAAVAAAHGAAAVCTAHHRDDQAETVLANLLRGAGPIGRMGIAPRRRLAAGIALMRPLLDASRDELRHHLVGRGIAWREDATNADEAFLRNRLRRRLLPGLEILAPGAAGALARLARRTRVRSRPARDRAAAAWRRRGDGTMPLDPDLDQQARWFLWRRLLRHLDAPLERQHLGRLDGLAAGAVGRRLHLGAWLLRRTPDGLAWEEARPAADLSEVIVDAPGSWRRDGKRLILIAAPPPDDPRGDAWSAWLDTAAVALPLRWRTPRPGERWRSLGAPGSQPIAKTLAERGVPSRRRALMPVLADHLGVVWIPGVALAERARLTPATLQAWRLMVGPG